MQNVYSGDVLGRGSAVADEGTVARLRTLAHWMDDRYRIPGTSRRVGLDGLIGLVPGIGDAATTVISLYIVLEAWRLGVPNSKLAQMGVNVGIDSVLGAIPVVGDLFDMTWKSNRRNVRLVLDHLEEELAHGRPRPDANVRPANADGPIEGEVIPPRRP